jgi:hypothetical protein
MIKSLKKYQVQLTPFEATKNWALNNSDNDNLLLTEDDFPIALEFIDYGDGSGLPYENSLCDIALEQQGTDLATVEDGLYVTGPFYPDTEPANIDGTYKRSIYYQVRTMFYNLYLYPTKIWGTENIDFELSKTKRILAEQFRLFDIPRIVFGDKMTPKSITMTDNSLDNPYTVTDDGNGNMFAGTNLFSHQQELGEYGNEFIANESSSLCDWYWANGETVYSDIPTLAVSFFGGEQENQLRTDTASLSIGFLYGQNIDYPYYEYSTLNLNLVGGSITESVIVFAATASMADIQPLSLSFYSGFNADTVQVVTMSYETSSLNLSFVSGSNQDTTFVATMSYESASLTLGFVSGSNNFTTYVVTHSYEPIAYNIGFLTGSHG